MKLHKEWQDYSIDINTEENPVRGDRAIIDNLIMALSPLWAVYDVFVFRLLS